MMVIRIMMIAIWTMIMIKSWALAVGDRLSVSQSAECEGEKAGLAGSVN